MNLLAAEAEAPNVLAVPLDELILGIVAFLIVFWLLSKLALPGIRKALDERTATIEGGIERAAAREAEANALYEQYQAQLAEARTEAAQIRAQAQSDKLAMVEEARVEAAEAALGEPLGELVTTAPAEALTRTREAQLAVLLTSLVAWTALEPSLLDLTPTPVAFAGHSLGQVTALIAAGVIGVEEGVRFVALAGALVGAAIGAREIQIWTDVDGMLTADPRVVANPRLVPRLPVAPELLRGLPADCHRRRTTRPSVLPAD